MKGIALVAVSAALAFAGCGSSGEETFREHQVKQVVRKIVFMERLPRLIHYQLQRGEGEAAERNELWVSRIETHLEGVNPALLSEACERVEAARICGGG
jgi:hypothetical protein